MVATEPVLSDESIIDMVRKGDVEEVGSDDDGADSEECIEKPTSVAVRNAVETLMNFSLFSGSDEIRSSTIGISKLVESELVRNLKQASITDFLQK